MNIEVTEEAKVKLSELSQLLWKQACVVQAKQATSLLFWEVLVLYAKSVEWVQEIDEKLQEQYLDEDL
ncbi:MAG: hypothetical protein Q9218_003935 [Villophora microphyllina]